MTKYLVTAQTGYRGFAEGEEFDADLSEDEERRAKARGSIKPVKNTKSKKEEEDDG